MESTPQHGTVRPRTHWATTRATFAGLTLVGLALGGAAWGAETVKSEPTGWQDHVTLTLSDRVRGEFVDWFTPHAGNAPDGAQRYDFFANQLRAGAKVTLPYTLLVIEGQDTQFVNLPKDASLAAGKGGNLGPGAVYYANTHWRDQGEVFLKQGYFTLKDLPGADGFALTGGRVEYSDGLETVPTDAALAWLKRARVSERLIGPFGYTHVTRSLDGVKAVYDMPDFNVTAIGTRPTDGGFEISANRELDIWLAGLTATLKKLEDLAPLDARLFYLYYRDERDHTVGVTAAYKVDNRSTVSAQDALRKKDNGAIGIHTWGGHAITVVDAGPGKVDGLVWAAIQAGDWGTLDHFAWAYALETGYQLPKVFAAPWLRVGYNRSSGDSDPNDKSHKTFFQLLPTARMYAQTPFFNLMNNEDLFAQFVLKPHEKVTVRSDYHWLRLTSSRDLWYSGGGATSNQFFGFPGLSSGGSRELGHLADLAVTVALLKQLTAYAYYGHVFGQDVVRKNFSGASANYGYVELTFRY